MCNELSLPAAYWIPERGLLRGLTGKSSQTILVAVSAPRYSPRDDAKGAASSAVMMVDAKSAPMVGLQTSGMETAPGIELMLPNKYD